MWPSARSEAKHQLTTEVFISCWLDGPIEYFMIWDRWVCVSGAMMTGMRKLKYRGVYVWHSDTESRTNHTCASLGLNPGTRADKQNRLSHGQGHELIWILRNTERKKQVSQVTSSPKVAQEAFTACVATARLMFVAVFFFRKTVDCVLAVPWYSYRYSVNCVHWYGFKWQSDATDELGRSTAGLFRY